MDGVFICREGKFHPLHFGILQNFVSLEDSNFRTHIAHILFTEKLCVSFPSVRGLIIDKFISLIYNGTIKVSSVKDMEDLQIFIHTLGIEIELEFISDNSACETPEFISLEGDEDSLDNINVASVDKRPNYFRDFKAHVDEIDNNVPEFKNYVRSKQFEPFKTPPGGQSPEIDKSELFCSKTCSKNCETVIHSWSDEFRTEIRREFEKGTNRIQDCKNRLIQHVQGQFYLGIPTGDFYINGHQLCIGAMTKLTMLSRHILTNVLKDFSIGITNYQHGNLGMIKSLTSPAINFIREGYKMLVSIFLFQIIIARDVI